MALKDTKLEEKEQLVVKGAVLADEFRDRKTGKTIMPSDGSEILSKMSIDEDGILVTGDLLIDNTAPGDGFLYLNELSSIKDKENGDALFPLVDNAGKVLAVNESETGLVAVEVIRGIDLDELLNMNSDIGLGDNQIPASNQTLTSAEITRVKTLLEKFAKRGYILMTQGNALFLQYASRTSNIINLIFSAGVPDMFYGIGISIDLNLGTYTYDYYES